jgi:hypothetical protein
MGDSIQVVGVGAILIAALYLVVWGSAVGVAIDALRRPAADFVGVAEGRYLYAVVEGVYAAIFAALQMPVVAAAFSFLAQWLAVGTLTAVVLIFVYLLRVVYPSPKRLAARGGGPTDPEGC